MRSPTLSPDMKKSYYTRLVLHPWALDAVAAGLTGVMALVAAKRRS